MKEGQTFRTETVQESPPAFLYERRYSHDAVLPAADVAALFMVGLLGFMFTCFAFGAVAMARRSRRFANDGKEMSADLPFDPRRHQMADSSKQETEQRMEWEKDPDWWKKA